jgi:hypothetical protein
MPDMPRTEIQGHFVDGRSRTSASPQLLLSLCLTGRYSRCNPSTNICAAMFLRAESMTVWTIPIRPPADKANGQLVVTIIRMSPAVS